MMNNIFALTALKIKNINMVNFKFDGLFSIVSNVKIGFYTCYLKTGTFLI